jgi:uncharacterized membrane protein
MRLFSNANKSIRSVFSKDVDREVSSENKKLLVFAKSVIAGMNALVVLPPILIELGLTKVGNYFYTILGIFCHQRADRSFYLFGEKLLYSKSYITEQVPFNKIFTMNFSQRFTCADSIGCKFGVCSRCTGIYLGMLIGLLIAEIMISYKIPKVIPIIMLLPLAFDGIIQSIAYIIAPEHGFYESTNPRRFVTGLLFGLSVGYFIVSAVAEPIAKKEQA